MSTILPDGTVVPSYLSTEPMGQSVPQKNFSNVSLRQGEVRKIIYPDDKLSLTKKYVEYSVAVQYQEGNGPALSVLYPNCTIANLFGGVADKLRYTARAQKNEPKKGQVIGDGAKVLLLCVNGNIRRAYIIGGINEDKEPEKKDDGHNLFFEFNGIQFEINKDGEAVVTFRGATQIDGKLNEGADAEAEGTTLTFNKEGNVTIATPKEKQFIRVNHKDKKIQFLADEEWNVSVNGKMAFDIKKDIKIDGGTTMDVTIAKNVTIKSSGVLVGDATDAWPLFTTYRSNESTMHNMMTSAMAQLTAAGGLFSSAGPLMSIPVAGAIIAGPMIASAGAMITAAAGMLTSAIATFEGSASMYLSKKNKND